MKNNITITEPIKHYMACPFCGEALLWSGCDMASDRIMEYSDDDTAVIYYYRCSHCGRDYEIVDPCEEERNTEYSAYWGKQKQNKNEKD